MKPRIALLSGKAPYQAIPTGLPADRYTDRSLPGSTTVGGQFRPSASVNRRQRIARAIRSPQAIPSPCTGRRNEV
ncbi:hypothetical protein BHE74_00054964, partial [Ensete ventricosum]